MQRLRRRAEWMMLSLSSILKRRYHLISPQIQIVDMLLTNNTMLTIFIMISPFYVAYTLRISSNCSNSLFSIKSLNTVKTSQSVFLVIKMLRLDSVVVCQDSADAACQHIH